MNDEKLKILHMIADGKISPEEGADLLKALNQEQKPTGNARWLVIRVHEPETGKVHVNVKLPLSLAGKMLKFVNRFTDDADIDLEEVYTAITTGEIGRVIDVDTDDGTRVEIWLEA
jgi:hypothetical protein